MIYHDAKYYSSAFLSLTEKRESASIAPAPDVASAVVAPKNEAPPKKKRILSTPLDATTGNSIRYSNVENHYNAALCSISKCFSLLTKLNVDIDDEGHQIQKRVAASKKKAAPKKQAPKKQPSCSDKVSILSTEEEAMMQQIQRIARGGYSEGLEALIFG